MGIWKKDTCNIDIIVTISKRILGPGWWYGWVVVPDIIYAKPVLVRGNLMKDLMSRYLIGASCHHQLVSINVINLG